MMPQPFDQSRCVMRSGWVFIVAMTVAMVGLLGRVAQLQLNPVKPIAQRVHGRGATLKVFARRGALLDRRGRILAATKIGYRLFADPKLIRNVPDFIAHVAHATGLSPIHIQKKLNGHYDGRYVVLDPLLSDEQVAAVRVLDPYGTGGLRALGLQRRRVRIHPRGTLAGQVLGFVGADHQGLVGLELVLNEKLSGEPGRMRVLRDVHQRPLWVTKAGFERPVDGKDVRLSIDATIQRIAQRELAAACEHYQAKGGECVVMDARTGQILAMVSWPLFDPDRFRSASPSEWRNRCLEFSFEPGSVFKPFIFAAATAWGFAEPDELIHTTEAGFWIADSGRGLHDAHGHGVLTWDEVLVYSSNIGMAKIGQRMGAERLYEAVRAFGFGEPTGIALPGEAAGIVNPLDTWTSYSITSIPMGQEIAVTALQLVQAFSTFANGGLMVKPTIIAGREPVYQRVIDERTADHVRHVLRRVVTEGTGDNAQSDLYRIWGKTGTAQIPDLVHGGYKEGVYVGSFLCGAPLENPRIIVLVSLHETNAEIGYYGGTVAAPAAREIVEQTLLYLGVEPDVRKEKQ